MRTNFLSTNFLNTPKIPGHPGKIPGTSQIPLSETQGRQTFEGEHEFFGHHPFAWKTPTPPGGAVSGPKKLIFVFFSLAWMSQVILTLQGYFCLASFKVKITFKDPLGS